MSNIEKVALVKALENRDILKYLTRLQMNADNDFTANQITATTSGENTTGFDKIYTTETLSSSTEQRLDEGLKSCKIITPGSQAGEGVKMSITNDASTLYNVGMLVYLPSGALISLGLSDLVDKSSYFEYTGKGRIQFIEGSFTTDAHTTLYALLQTKTRAQALSMYYLAGFLRPGAY